MVDPKDDQCHIERQSKGEKRDRAKERLVGQRDGGLLDFVDRHGDA
jgi:hypothetical protein